MEFKWLWPLWTIFDWIIVIIVAHTDGLQESVCRKKQICLFCLEINVGQWVWIDDEHELWLCSWQTHWLIEPLIHWLTWKIDFGSSLGLWTYTILSYCDRGKVFFCVITNSFFFSRFNATRRACLSDSPKNVLINVFENYRKINTCEGREREREQAWNKKGNNDSWNSRNVVINSRNWPKKGDYLCCLYSPE